MSEVIRTWNKDCWKSIGEKDKSIGGGGWYAIWLYARKRDNRCSFIVRRMQEEYREKDKKLYMCFVDLEKAFDRVPRKVMQWALRRKGYQRLWWKQWWVCLRVQRQRLKLFTKIKVVKSVLNSEGHQLLLTLLLHISHLIFFVCSKCEKATNGVGKEQQEVVCDEVETVKGFCYLGDRLNASGGCEAAVIARTRVGWKKFRECREILFGKRLSFLERKDIRLRNMFVVFLSKIFI